MENHAKGRVTYYAMKDLSRVHKSSQVKDRHVKKRTTVDFGIGQDNRGGFQATKRVDHAEQKDDLDAETDGGSSEFAEFGEDGDGSEFVDAEKDGGDGEREPVHSRNSASKANSSTTVTRFEIDPALLPPVNDYHHVAPVPFQRFPTAQGPAPARSQIPAQHPTDPKLLAPPALMSGEYAPAASLPSVQDTGSVSAMKHQYSKALGKKSNGKRLTGDRDPENIEIKRLRQECDMEFEAIARYLNGERVKRGLPADLSANAVYSRYKRNAPLIAAANGDEFVPTAKDDRYARIRFARVKPIKGFNPHEDALLIQAHNDVQAGFWSYVSARVVQLGGDSHPPEICARRFQYVGI